MFWNTFYELCRKNNTYPLTVVKETGIATGSITKWKNGTVPSGATLQKIADYFGVPVSSLFDDSDTPATPAELQDLISRTRNLSAEEIKELDDYLNFIISKRSQP